MADRGVVPMMGAKATSQPEGRPRLERNLGGSARDRTQGRVSLPAKLAQVNEAARRSRQTRFTALLHHVGDEALLRAFRRQRRAASAGVDGVTVADYEQNLDANIRNLCDRVHAGRYRPQPVRRTTIPKADGGRRPLGIPALEDKIVQGAVAEVLSAIYEVDFLGFSYGSRPGRNPHQALDALQTTLMAERINWVLDADIRSFFDSVDHEWLLRMVAHRVADPRGLRLISQWLRVGVIDGGTCLSNCAPNRQSALPAGHPSIRLFRRRDLFASLSLRFADPRIGLLAGSAWEAARPSTCRTLGVPAQGPRFRPRWQRAWLRCP